MYHGIFFQEKLFFFFGQFSSSHASIGRSVIISEDHKLSVASERQRIINMGVQLNPDQTRLCGLAVARAFGDMFPKVIVYIFRLFIFYYFFLKFLFLQSRMIFFFID